MSELSRTNFETLKLAAKGILESRRKDHQSRGQQLKVHAIYINLTPGKEDASTPELIVEKALGDSNLAEAAFHLTEASRYDKALTELNETTYEESN